MGCIEKCYFDNPCGKSFHYLKYLPADYDPQKKYPLVVFLHGAGERGKPDGSELDIVKVHFWFSRAAKGEEFPFVMVAPQCTTEDYWGAYIESLNKFLDAVLAENAVDDRRVYLTGLSMGGTGTWLWSLANPERFAAIAPVCGTGVAWYGGKLKDKPVWAFHGDVDDAVPPSCSLEMVRSINQNGGHALLTLYPGVGHNAWDGAYAGSELMNWMLSYTNESKK